MPNAPAESPGQTFRRLLETADDELPEALVQATTSSVFRVLRGEDLTTHAVAWLVHETLRDCYVE